MVHHLLVQLLVKLGESLEHHPKVFVCAPARRRDENAWRVLTDASVSVITHHGPWGAPRTPWILPRAPQPLAARVPYQLLLETPVERVPLIGIERAEEFWRSIVEDACTDAPFACEPC